MNRTLFNNPIRKETTLEFFPDKLTINDFEEEIVNNFEFFKKNMENLKGVAIEPKYIEQWVEQYLAWLEIEEERQ